MAGTIELQNKNLWIGANWIYWALMDEILANIANDSSAIQYVIECKWSHNLSVPKALLDQNVNGSIIHDAFLKAMDKGASGVIQCKVEGRLLHVESQQQFINSMNELQRLHANVR